jgi:hypothetical protein
MIDLFKTRYLIRKLEAHVLRRVPPAELNDLNSDPCLCAKNFDIRDAYDVPLHKTLLFDMCFFITDVDPHSHHANFRC